FMEDCDCLGEIEMIVLDTEILTSDIVGMDFDDFDCPGFGDMVRDVFGGLERMNMLRYKNRKTGAMTNVRRVYWIESADCDTEEVLTYMFWDLTDKLKEFLSEERAILLIGFNPNFLDILSVLEDIGFKDLDELEPSVVKKIEDGWGFRYDMFFSE